MRKWAIWIPVLMVASLLYWTVALGLGGLSLFAVTAFDCGHDYAPAQKVGAKVSDSDTPITVNLVDPSSASAADDADDADDAEDTAGAGVTVDLVEDSAPAPAAADRNGPGATAV